MYLENSKRMKIYRNVNINHYPYTVKRMKIYRSVNITA